MIFPGSSVGEQSACNAGDPCLIPGSGRSPGEGNGYPLQYSGLENSMDCIDHGVTKSQIQLSDFHFHKIPAKLRNLGIYFYAITLIGILTIYSSLQTGEQSHTEIDLAGSLSTS